MTPKKTLRLSDVKNALNDARFRDRLPAELLPDVQAYLKNPGCDCNTPIYRKVLQKCAAQLAEYYPGRSCEPASVRNYWSVISCPVTELEAKLRGLPQGRKQIAVARWEDQVTVVVNELDVLS